MEDDNKIYTIINIFLISPVIYLLSSVVYGLKKAKTQKSFYKKSYKTRYIVNKKPVKIQFEEGVEIPIESLKEFSGMKANQVLSLRQKAIDSSPVFSLPNYFPDMNVYKLADGLPWISAREISCNGITKNIGKGPSRESFPILNPEALINNDIPGYGQPREWGRTCSEIDYLLPDKMIYNERKKTIYAYINATDFMNKFQMDKIPIFPSDSNARDLGYNWVYSPKENNKNVTFLNSPNVSDEIFDTRGYFHQGYACKLEGGCNNYSPRQEYYDAKILSNDAKVVFKLWKNKPFNKNLPADFNYEIIYH